MAAAHRLLLNPEVRLLTLTGGPGIGKTRLALQIASDVVEHFKDGVFFVDLAPVTDPDMVLPTVVRVLGLREGAGVSVEVTLLNHMRNRRLLLVLDNFEQVLDAAPQLIKLMQGSPWVKALVTTREALHLRGERRFPVPPLGVPDPSLFSERAPRRVKEHAQRQFPRLEVLASYPSVALFIERAQAIAPDFALTEENAEDVAAVCSRLEGVPLAIELAAARCGHLSPMEMRIALRSHLRLLTGGARDLPVRHRTLRGAIEWSYELLGESEKRLLRTLGVFVGDFAAEAVGAIFECEPAWPHSTSDLLNALVDKHLVRAERQSIRAAGTAPRVSPLVRFGLLEAVREYAVEQLERHGEVEKSKCRHADYYLGLAEQAEAHFTGPQDPEWGVEQIEWIDRLELDLDNMREALDWYWSQAEHDVGRSSDIDASRVAGERVAGASDLDNLHKGLRLATALRRVWLGRGYHKEGLQRLMELLAKVPKPLPSEQPQFRASYAAALLVVGRLSLLHGNVEAAGPFLDESLSIAVELKDRERVALILLGLGAAALAKRDYVAARSYGDECLKLYRQLGNKWGAAAALEDLGDVELSEGNFTVARSLLEKSLKLYRAVGENIGAAAALEDLGRIAYDQGVYTAASRVWEECLQLSRETGSGFRISQVLVFLGWAAVRQGNYGEAIAVLEEGLLRAQELGLVSTMYWGLVALGALEGAQNSTERAAVLFGAAEAFRSAEGISLSPTNLMELRSEIEAVQTRLQEAIWNRLWKRGAAMTIEEAISNALAHNLERHGWRTH
jgi:predicted ATPase